jgi:hypothetical protein
MDRTIAPEPAERSLRVFVHGGFAYDLVELQLLANGDLRLLHTLGGRAVALQANEYIQYWLIWYTVAAADVPGLVDGGTDVLEAVRDVLATPADVASDDGLKIVSRFLDWLSSKGVPYTRHEYDDYGD